MIPTLFPLRGFPTRRDSINSSPSKLLRLQFNFFNLSVVFVPAERALLNLHSVYGFAITLHEVRSTEHRTCDLLFVDSITIYRPCTLVSSSLETGFSIRINTKSKCFDPGSYSGSTLANWVGFCFPMPLTNTPDAFFLDAQRSFESPRIRCTSDMRAARLISFLR